MFHVAFVTGQILDGPLDKPGPLGLDNPPKALVGNVSKVYDPPEVQK